MRVVHVVCTYPPYSGGIGNSAFEVVSGLRRRGMNVDVITPRYRRDKKNENNEGVFRLKPFFALGNAAVLPQLIFRLKGYDVVHLHYPFFGASEFVLVAKLLLGKKMRLFLHYHMDALALGFKGIFFRMYDFVVLPFLAKKAERITCASLSYIESSRLSRYYKKNGGKFFEIGFGVDLDRFKVLEDVCVKDRGYVVFVGGLDKAHYFKGLDVLLKSFLVMKNKEVKLKIVGNGCLKRDYEKIVAEFGLSDRVEFLGGVSEGELVRTYSQALALVLPSVNGCEAFGLVLLEAMACGVPVIASRLPGVDSVFSDGEQGYYVNVCDEKDLAEKIDRVCGGGFELSEMGEKGRALVKEKYVWNKVVERVIGLYIECK